jgi:hypothetical protein
MAVLEIRVELPDGLAREAEARGLLTPESIESLIREEIRRRQVDALFDAADRLAASREPPLTQEELEEEIQAARRQRRGAHARGG